MNELGLELLEFMILNKNYGKISELNKLIKYSKKRKNFQKRI